MSEQVYYDIDDGKVELKHIEPGKSFLWSADKYLCRRVILTGSIDLYDLAKHELYSEGIPVIVVDSGQLTVLGADELVKQVVVEHHVVG